MFCKGCGAYIEQNEKFCGNCGLTVSTRSKLMNKQVGMIVCLVVVNIVVFGVIFLGMFLFSGENNEGLEETLALQRQEYNLDARPAPSSVPPIEPELTQPITPPIEPELMQPITPPIEPEITPPIEPEITPPISQSPSGGVEAGREPLPANAANDTSPMYMYTDHLHWIWNSTQMQAGLKNFHRLTGVRPHVYIVGEINGSTTPSPAQVEDFAIGLLTSYLLTKLIYSLFSLSQVNGLTI